MHPEATVLVTGCAGFIGYHTTMRLLGDGYTVAGLDNLSPYYDIALKRSRLNLLLEMDRFSFIEGSIENSPQVRTLMEKHRPDIVIHLAAQAGVRYSLEQPEEYLSANVNGFFHILEACREFTVQHFIYASSSSVYGANAKIPLTVGDHTDQPISFYAATKKTNELMAHTYSHLHGLPTTGLRFFTAYGPWGRPDMALFKFTDAIVHGRTIDVYDHGRHERDFTYIDDTVEGIMAVAAHPPNRQAPYRVYNLGSGRPVKLLDFIEELERLLGKQAERRYLPIQPGDMPTTYADMDDFIRDFGWRPVTTLRQGMERFIAWYMSYYLQR